MARGTAVAGAPGPSATPSLADSAARPALSARCTWPRMSPSLGSAMPVKVSTVNLHTTGQTYFGDIRGQIHLVDD